jgi:hypothetical protein
MIPHAASASAERTRILPLKRTEPESWVARQQQVIICNINDQQLQNKRLLAIILVLSVSHDQFIFYYQPLCE